MSNTLSSIQQANPLSLLILFKFYGSGRNCFLAKIYWPPFLIIGSTRNLGAHSWSTFSLANASHSSPNLRPNMWRTKFFSKSLKLSKIKRHLLAIPTLVKCLRFILKKLQQSIWCAFIEWYFVFSIGGFLYQLVFFKICLNILRKNLRQKHLKKTKFLELCCVAFVF